MKLAPIGLAAIVILSGLSPSFAQDQRSGDNSSRYEGRQGNREQAGDDQPNRGYDRRGSRRDADEPRSGNNADVQNGGDSQVSFGSGARFRFARGSDRFDIRCPANEPTRACLQAASEFMRQMNLAPAEKSTEVPGAIPKP